jgi:hypothetical protein
VRGGRRPNRTRRRGSFPLKRPPPDPSSSLRQSSSLHLSGSPTRQASGRKVRDSVRNRCARLSLARFNVTLGCAVNPKPSFQEGRGTFFFSMDVTDPFPDRFLMLDAFRRWIASDSPARSTDCRINVRKVSPPLPGDGERSQPTGRTLSVGSATPGEVISSCRGEGARLRKSTDSMGSVTFRQHSPLVYEESIRAARYQGCCCSRFSRRVKRFCSMSI